MLNVTSKVCSLKEKKDRFEFYQNEKKNCFKTPIKKMKRQAMTEKNFCKSYTWQRTLTECLKNSITQ